MNNREYVFINPKSSKSDAPDSIYYVLCDVCENNRFKAFDSIYAPISNSFLRLARRIHTSYKINRIVNLPFKCIWKKSLDCIEWDKNKEYYIIFANTALLSVSTKYYLKLKKKYNIKYILLMMEQWNSKNAENARQYYNAMDFEYIFTIYPQDEEKYGFIHTMNYYSKLFDNDDVDIAYDSYHSSWVVDREALIHGYIKSANENGVTYKMRLMDPKCEFANEDNVIINKTLSYRDIVKEALKCNCVVEILRTGLDAATNRYYEAICYNKKLLTNNKNVVNLPFYNPTYMHVFEKPEDIDWKWVKERIPIDYHYDGRFSPVHIIDEIENIERKRKELGKK